MIVAVHRELVTPVHVEVAWHYFANASEWPTWHTDLVRVDVTPPGELGPWSVATLYPRRGPSTSFRMTTFAPYRQWTWVARVLWFSVTYDHTFERLDDGQTRLVLHVEVDGAGHTVFGRVLGALANRSLDKALPRLAREFEARAAESAPFARQ